MRIIGRLEEKRILEGCLSSKAPEFVAVYGRRRGGGQVIWPRNFRHGLAIP